MTKGMNTPSEASPATARGSPREGINAAGLADSANPAMAMIMDATADGSRNVQFEEEDAQGHASDEEKEEDEYEEKAELGHVRTTAELLGEVEELSLQVGRMGVPRPVERNLAAEFGEDADDDDQDVAQGERPPLVPRATRNADTPSANKVLAQLGEEMMVESEWMKLFNPVPLSQARWPSLGPLLAGPTEWSNTAEVAEATILLLKGMGFRVNSRPSPWILSDWNLDLASMELLRWKGKLKKAFGVQMPPRLLTNPSGTMAGTRLGRSMKKSHYLGEPGLVPPVTDPSKVPLPRTPETKPGDKFRATVSTPYFEDSHMLSPKKPRAQQSRPDIAYGRINSAEADEDSDDDRGYGLEREETVKDQIYHLSNDRGDRGGSQYLELRTHVSLDKIMQFDGRRYRSDDSLQWLKRFIYEMKGTRMPQNSWCEPFSLSLGRTAKSWYRQLPRKTQTRWNLLSEAFLDYYCSQFDQSARTRYYSAKRKDKESICDFLTRLNGYARTAKIQYEKGGADAADHVEQFLLTCGDDDIMDMLYPLQLNDIQRVEQIINKKILGEKRKKQRDRLTSGRSRENSHREDRRSDRRRDDRRDPRRDERRERRINSADYGVEEIYGSTEYAEANRGQLTRDAGRYDSEDSDEYKTPYWEDDNESDEDEDYVDTGFASDRGDSAKTPRNSARQYRSSNDGRDRRDSPRERQQYGPCAACGGMGHSAHFCRRRCKFCKQVHEVGQCELFRRYEKLASFVKNNVDKSKVPEEFQDLYKPSDLNSTARQH